MKIFVGLSALLVFHLVSALPAPVTNESEDVKSVVREKRNPEGDPKQTLEEKITSNLPAVVDTSGQPKDEGENIGRFKKQACAQLPVGTKQICGEEPGEKLRENHPEFIIMPSEEAPIFSGPLPAMRKSARTFEPIYSFGPLSFNGAGYGSSAYSGGGYGSYAIPAGRPSGVSSVSTQTSYSPVNLPYQTIMPYTMVHHHPILHHSFSLTRGGAGAAVKPQVVYYDTPEPVYVDAEDSAVTHSAVVPSPVPLYCQTIKSKELAKALSPTEEKANSTTDESNVQEHIERVNEIKEEISRLNLAAQKIVDQQERLARMQQEHIAAVNGKTDGHPIITAMHAAGPVLMRHHESQVRQYMPHGGYGGYGGYGSYGGYGGFSNYREADESIQRPQEATTKPPLSDEGGKKMEEVTKPKVETFPPGGMIRQNNYVLPYGRADVPMPLQTMQPLTYPEAYGYPRSETGFPVPEYYYKSDANIANYPRTPEDTHFFMRLLDMGKKMGIISKDMQPSLIAPVTEKKKPDVETKSENLLDDLTTGGKSDSENQPSKMSLPTSTKSEAAPSKKDKRGLVQKKE